MPREDIGAKSTDAGEKRNKSGNASFQVQDDFFNTLQEMSRDWMARATAEVELGLKLSTKLSAARSVPDAIAAYQEWLSARRLAHAPKTRVD